MCVRVHKSLVCVCGVGLVQRASEASLSLCAAAEVGLLAGTKLLFLQYHMERFTPQWACECVFVCECVRVCNGMALSVSAWPMWFAQLELEVDDVIKRS